MPLYEFICTDCEKSFEELVPVTGKIEDVRCPACQGEQVKKKVSTIAARRFPGGKSTAFWGGAPASSCNSGGT